MFVLSSLPRQDSLHHFITFSLVRCNAQTSGRLVQEHFDNGFVYRTMAFAVNLQCLVYNGQKYILNRFRIVNLDSLLRYDQRQQAENFVSRIQTFCLAKV